MKKYYAVSGDYANNITISAFASKRKRDEFVASYHSRRAVTRAEAIEQLIKNNKMHSNYRKYGAPYSPCYGTTGKFSDVELFAIN